MYSFIHATITTSVSSVTKSNNNRKRLVHNNYCRSRLSNSSWILYTTTNNKNKNEIWSRRRKGILCCRHQQLFYSTTATKTNYTKLAIKKTSIPWSTRINSIDCNHHHGRQEHDHHHDHHRRLLSYHNNNNRNVATTMSSVKQKLTFSSSNSIRRILQHQQQYNNNNNNMQQQQQRMMNFSTWASIVPDFVTNFSIWGGSGSLLKLLHEPVDGMHLLPYWGGFIAISLMVRTLLIPVVIYGAKTASRFAKIVPDVQFLLSLFQNDMKQLREQSKNTNNPNYKKERWMLMKMNFRSLGGLYKLHKIKPYAVFLSPLIQLPIFWYISIDLRKIVHGLDPNLAQQLVDCNIGWITDMTEPDPWYGLPIVAGLIMYMNVEVAVGSKNLAGQAASKTDSAILLKDLFQSVAVFMPCFTCQLPSGVQIYIVTSFFFTLGQSAALRNNSIRQYIGLPIMGLQPTEAKYAKQFIELKQLEKKAREIRGDGPLLGKGLLAHGFEVSFPGTYRTSTIQGSVPLLSLNNTNNKDANSTNDPTTEDYQSSRIKAMTDLLPREVQDMPYIHGISAPLPQVIKYYQQQQQKQDRNDGTIIKTQATAAPTTLSPMISQQQQQQQQQPAEIEYMPDYDDETIERANRGELPRKIQILSLDEPKTKKKLSLKRFTTNNNNNKKHTSSKKRSR